MGPVRYQITSWGTTLKVLESYYGSHTNQPYEPQEIKIKDDLLVFEEEYRSYAKNFISPKCCRRAVFRYVTICVISADYILCHVTQYCG